MNFGTPNNVRPHWNYFLAFEKDLEAVSRYIEFCPENLNTYSIELAHLLLSAASEVDTLAKCICGILAPNAKPDNINEYRAIIKAGEENETYGVFVLGMEPAAIKEEKRKHSLSALKVYVPRYNLEFVPWESWEKDKNPDWWQSYNKVKHERNLHFNKATLNNALHALAALLAFNYVYCRLEITKTKPEYRYQYRASNVTSYMEPESMFLRFGKGFYPNPLYQGW
jgi:hypothetical protein